MHSLKWFENNCSFLYHSLHKKKLLRYSQTILVVLTMCLFSCKSMQNIGQYSDQEVQNPYYSADRFEYIDKIYKNNIRTALLHPVNEPIAYPILDINGRAQLEISFDDLEGDVKNYSYNIVHCNADWTPSDISPFDYIDGFTEDTFDDYRYAFNTLQEYTQYRAFIPNNRLRFTQTGNYLLTVFEGNDPDDVVITKRFMIYEDKLSMNSSVLRPNISRYLPTHQRLSFTINYGNLSGVSPLTDFKVFVLQNGRWDNAIKNLIPQFIRDKELVYDYTDQSLFRAGKEFRFFDFRDLEFSTQRVKKVWLEEEENHLQIAIDEKRPKDRYSFWKDMNGQYYVGRFGGFTRVDADYAWTHFKLVLDEPISTGNVYIFGALSNWKPQKRFQLHYDYEEKAYKTAIYLKQGVYNYQYVIWEDGSAEINDQELEGNHWETENSYLILVYYRPFNARFDQLIGIREVNSRQY